MKHFLLLAEKPSLKEAIRQAYVNHKSDVEAKVGAIDFMALHGHAYQYLEPKNYQQWNIKWEDIDLPMIPEKFKLQPIPDSKEIITKIKEGINSKKYDAIIVATDSDTEGNGIYYNIAEALNLTSFPAYRFFETDQTEAGIVSSLMSLTDYWTYPRDVRMTDAYKLRSQRDWLIGMNFTTGFTVKAGFLLKIGSVKSPTLKLIYDNCKSIDDFVPHTDYAITASFNENYKGVYIDNDGNDVRFETKEKAKTFSEDIKPPFIVDSITKKTVSTPAPQLYKLSDIQIDAGKQFGYDLEKTLNIIQELYEMKYLSYPRTDGRYISEEKAKDLDKLIGIVKGYPELKEYAEKITTADIDRVKKDKRIVNTEEAAKASHDAILPTFEKPDYSKLNKDQKNILDLVYRRLIALFMPPLKEDKTTIITKAGEYTFKTNGKVTVQNGWTDLYEKKMTDIVLPDLKKGQTVNLKEFEYTEKTTQPPKRFTQASLGDAMENIHRYIDDKELKKVMKAASGLGQPSSRGAIIKELFTSGYIEEKGKSKGIYMTDKGTKYVEIVHDFSIVNPVLNAEWETTLNQVRAGEEDYKSAHDEMISFVKDTVKELKDADIKKTIMAKNCTDIACPNCGKNLILGKFGYFCSGKNDGCTFSVSNEICGKKISEKYVKMLSKDKVTSVITGFVSPKSGKMFDAKLKVGADGKVSFDFDTAEKMKGECKCPFCGKPMKSTGRS